MEHINKICKEQEYPIEVENSATLGNHAVAARDIPRGEGLLRAIPYAAEVFDNYKKRMCHVCLLYHGRGSFQLRCQDCDQVYFCSAACRDIAMGSPSTTTSTTTTSTTTESPETQDTQDTSTPTLNTTGYHAKVCRTLRKLATWNSDRHTKSIIKLLLNVLLNHWKERQGIPTTYRAHRILEIEREREKRQAQLDSEKDDGVESLGQTLSSGAQLHENANTESKAVDSIIDGAKDAWDEIQEPIENDFFDVMRLQSHFEDWDEEDNKDWDRQAQIVLTLLELCGLTEIAVPGSSQELRMLTAQDIKQMISALESNAFGMFDRSKSKPICFGRAIYPIASFFNHSCDCNSTAVQADGSEEKATGDDVLGFVGAEEEDKKQKKLAKNKEAKTKSKKPKTGNLGDSAPSTPLSSSSPAQTPPPSSPSPQVDTPEDSSEATPISSDNGEEALEPSSEADSYDTRVGEFRMMTFFAIRDISKGQDITISYIDTEMPLQARRLALLSDYHFHCCCERCVREEKARAPGSSKKGAKEKDNKKKGGGGGKKSRK